MVDMDGNIYFASGPKHNLDPSRYPGLNTVSLGDLHVVKILRRMSFCRFILNRGCWTMQTHTTLMQKRSTPNCTYIEARANRWQLSKVKEAVNGIYKGFKACDLSLSSSGLKSFLIIKLYLSEEVAKILKESKSIKEKIFEFIKSTMR